MNKSIMWTARISEAVRSSTDYEELIIRGTALAGDVVQDGVLYAANELRRSAPTLNGKPVMKDDKNSVDGIVGRTTNSSFDERDKTLHYQARIADKGIIAKIKKGLVTSVRVGSIVKSVTKENDVLVPHGIEFVSLSFTATGRSNVGASFSSAIREVYNQNFDEENKMEKQSELTLEEKQLLLKKANQIIDYVKNAKTATKGKVDNETENNDWRENVHVINGNMMYFRNNYDAKHKRLHREHDYSDL